MSDVKTMLVACHFSRHALLLTICLTVSVAPKVSDVFRIDALANKRLQWDCYHLVDALVFEYRIGDMPKFVGRIFLTMTIFFDSSLDNRSFTTNKNNCQDDRRCC
jgi:hypothetical protein